MKKALLAGLFFFSLSTRLTSQCATISTPTNNCTAGDYIDTFVLNGIAATGNGGCSPNGYGFFSTPVWNLPIGSINTWSAYCSGGIWNEGIGIWIDINNDGFYTASEQLYASPSPTSTHNALLTIPFSATVANNVRMRMRDAWNIAISNTAACVDGLGTWGETEDHLVNLVCPTTALTLAIAATSTYVCQGTPVTLTATGAGTFAWTGGITNATSFTPTSTQSYTVTGGIPGCPSATATAVRMISVTSTPLPINAQVSPTVTCAGQPATLIAQGASNYTFSPGPPAGGTSSVLTVAPAAPTIYTITGYYGSGCPGSTTVALAVNPIPTISVVGSSSIVCPGSSATLTATGATSYSWQAGGTGSSIVVTPTAAAQYIVTGTTSNCSSSSSTIVILHTVSQLLVNASKTLVCVGAPSTLTAMMGNAVTYQWAGGPSTNTYVVNPASQQVYTVTATDNNTCSASKTLMVNVFDPTVTVSSSGDVCPGGTATLSAPGGSSIVVSPTVTTTYSLSTVTISNNIACSKTGTVTVVVNPNPTVTAASDRTLICRFEAVTLTASGAISYTWTWLTGFTTGSTIIQSPLTQTNYSVVGTDSNGCKGNSLVNVKVSICEHVGLSELQNANAYLDVYPNPSTGIFYLKSVAISNFRLFNETGQVVMVFTIEPGQHEIEVDMRNLLPGLYLIEGRGPDAVISQRLIKSD